MVNLVYNARNVSLAVSRGNGVIKAREMAALDEAHSIRHAAEEKAAQITDAAQAGYASEKERGYAEGRDLASKEAFERLLSEQIYLDEKLKGIEKALAELVKVSIRSIISSFDDITLIETTIRSALQRMRRENRLQIFIAPSLIDGLAPLVAKLEATFPEIQSIELIEDGSLTLSDFIIESSTSRIECNLAGKLDQLDDLVDKTVAGIAPEDHAVRQDRGLSE